MKHLITRISVAFLTLITGVAATGLFIGYYYSNFGLINTDSDLTVEFSKELKSERSSQSITFTSSGNVTNFKPYYESSDGKILRKFCQEYKSVAEATEILHKDVAGKDIIEKTLKLDKNGKTIGEKIIFTDSPELNEKTKIAWTDGTHYFRLEAPSLKHALLFEESSIWNDGYCL